MPGVNKQRNNHHLILQLLSFILNVFGQFVMCFGTRDCLIVSQELCNVWGSRKLPLAMRLLWNATRLVEIGREDTDKF